MAVDFNAWLAHSAKVRVFLVETSALRPSDMAIIPIYLADRGLVINARAYLGCTVDLPRLTRQSNDNLNPNRVPTWGELTQARDDLVNPDAYNTLSWESLLSPDYVFRDRPLTILLGGLPEDGFTYEDFEPVFTGFIDQANWRDDQVTFTLYDKGRDFEQKIPYYALPESPEVAEASWGLTVPLVLGSVLNYQPVLISETEAGDYPWRYALSGWALSRVNGIYFNNAAQNWSWSPGPVPGMGIDSLPTPAPMELRLKDLFPPRKDGEGSATMQTSGAYTGALYRAEWLVRIATITRFNVVGQFGPEVGLAGFNWYLNGVLQNPAPLLTWKLAPGAVTKDPAVGIGTVVLGGDYNGEIKRDYRLKIVTEGKIGGTQTPQFSVSDDGGATESDPIDIPNNDPLDIGRGLTAAFAGEVGSVGAVTKTAGAGDGAMTAAGAFTGDVTTNYQFVVTAKGGETIWVKWSNDGGANWTGPVEIVVPTASPWAIEEDISVEFPDNIADYDVGNTWEFSAYPPFVVDDLWSFALVEVPIPLADGVAVQFFTQAGADFAVGDEWSFILGSSLCLANVGDGVSITVDAEGPVGWKAGEIIQMVLREWRGWTPADFNLPALAAFNAAVPYKMGLLVDSPTEISQIVEDLLTGIPCLYTIDRNGQFFIAELTRPSGEPVMDMEDGKTEVLDSPEGSDGSDGIYHRVYLEYGKNHNVESNPAGAPTQERVEWLRRENRQVSQRDSTVQEIYPRARELGPLVTALQDLADAKALVAKNLNLYKTPWLAQKVVSPELQAFILDLGAVVRLRGDLYRLRNVDLDYTQKQATLDLGR